ncbi:MAG: hypothetical protein OXD54_16060 [Candidatus Poribacteria bacterium]|nr:hypothetical protein [Candidatus Poribacteria bacterium]
MHRDNLNLQVIRSNTVLQKLFAFAKRQKVELYLVGGSVRDLLLNRPTTDYDFALKADAILFAKSFARSIGAAFVLLEEQPPTARVIAKIHQPKLLELCIDFTQFRAKTLTDDLRLRDLTINALAIPLETVMESEQPEVIDPCNGINDLEKRQLLFPSEQVILDDPLRLMRIFRFSAQLDFDIPQESVNLVQNHSQLLPNVSPERVRDELFKLLNIKKSKCHLKLMCEVGLLSHVIPSVEQNSDSWTALEQFERTTFPISLNEYRNEIDTYLNEELGLYANRRSLIKLSLLYQEKPVEIGKSLRLSRKAVQFLKCIVTEYQQLLLNGDITKKQIINFLRTSTTDWLGVLLFSAVIHSIPTSVLKQVADTYYQHLLPILKQGRLITGEDLIREFKLKEGREIGVLLKQIEERQHYGEIRTREEAFATAAALIGRVHIS